MIKKVNTHSLHSQPPGPNSLINIVALVAISTAKTMNLPTAEDRELHKGAKKRLVKQKIMPKKVQSY